MDHILPYLYALVIVVLNSAWIFLILIGLPGIWLMLLTAALAEWLIPNVHFYDTFTLVIAGVLAVLAECVEFVAAAGGARRAGASARGTLGAMLGGIAGAIAGTFLIPVPVLGSIIGACSGAFLGAFGAERARGRSEAAAIGIGRGAAMGHLFGTVIKLATGVLIWLLLAVAAFWP